MGFAFAFTVRGEACDNEAVPFFRQVCRRPVDAYFIQAALALDFIGDESVSVCHVEYVYLFVVMEVRGVHQVPVDGNAPFVFDVCVGHRYAVYFGFKKCPIHLNSPSGLICFRARCYRSALRCLYVRPERPRPPAKRLPYPGESLRPLFRGNPLRLSTLRRAHRTPPLPGSMCLSPPRRTSFLSHSARVRGMRLSPSLQATGMSFESSWRGRFPP